MDQWLVRTAQNVIAGPYSKEQILHLVREGQLNTQDEVCAANSYWFYLHEREEVTRQLGVEVPRSNEPRADDEEVTETQTQTDTNLSQIDYDAFERELGGSAQTTVLSSRRRGPQPAPSASVNSVEGGTGAPHALHSARVAASASEGGDPSSSPDLTDHPIFRRLAPIGIALGVALLVILILKF